MKKYIRMSLCAAIAMMAISACDESEYDIPNLFPEEYHKILYILNNGEQDVTLYKTGDDTNFNISVVKAGCEANLEADVHMRVLTQAEVDEQFSEVTGVPYLVIPETAYSMENQDMHFTSEDQYLYLNVSVNPEGVEQFINDQKAADPSNADYMKFVLPIQAEGVGANDSINANKDQVILNIAQIILPTIGIDSESTGIEVQEHTLDLLADLQEVVPIVMDVENQWNIDCTFEEDADFIAQYNEDNGTNFKPFPEGLCSFDQTVSLAPGQQGQLHVNVALSQLTDIGDYMFAVRMTGVSQFVMNENTRYVVAVRVRAPLLDNTGWVATANTEATNEGSNGYPYCVLDGSTDTYWHSSYSPSNYPLPHWIMIDMQESHEVWQIGIGNRKNNRYTKAGQIQITDTPADESSWTTIGDFLMDQNSNDIQIFDTEHRSGRYLRIYITESYHKNNCTAVSEIQVHGY